MMLTHIITVVHFWKIGTLIIYSVLLHVPEHFSSTSIFVFSELVFLHFLQVVLTKQILVHPFSFLACVFLIDKKVFLSLTFHSVHLLSLCVLIIHIVGSIDFICWQFNAHLLISYFSSCFLQLITIFAIFYNFFISFVFLLHVLWQL